MSSSFSPALAAVLLLAANTPPPSGDAPPIAPPSSAIVGGHHVQPRASNGATPDVPRADADEVDRLYQQLMRETAPGSSPAGGSGPSR